MIKKFALFLFVITLASCFKDENTTTTTIIKNDPRYVIAACELVIEVADENEKPMAGLTASLSEEIKVVNKSSFFHFNGKRVNKFEELLRITDQNGNEYDYLIHSQANEVNYKKVNLFTNKQNKSFASNEDFMIPISSDVQINLTKDNYQVNVNQSYTGQIETRYNHFDVQKESHLRSLPGGKFGIKDNQLWLLEMEDAFEFKIYSADKQKLTFTKPVSIQLSAVKTGSALFYYDANSHAWTFQQEVSSNQAIFTSHPGTYCIAKRKAFTILKGQWMTNSLPTRQAWITLKAAGYSEQVLTSNSGKWEAIVPQGEDIDIIHESLCSAVETKSVKATGESFDAGIFNTTSGQLVPYEVKGQFLDCKDQPIGEGFLNIRSASINKTLYIDSTNFKLSVPLCAGEDVSVFFTSVAADFQTTLLKDVNSNMDIGKIYLCSDVKDEYLTLNIDGSIRIFTTFTKTLDTKILQIASKTDFIDELNLKFNHDNQVGVLDNSKANIIWNDDEIGGFGIELNCGSSTNCGFQKIELTYFNQDEKLVKGTFTGRFWLKTLNPLGAVYKNISGEFQVKQ